MSKKIIIIDEYDGFNGYGDNISEAIQSYRDLCGDDPDFGSVYVHVYSAVEVKVEVVYSVKEKK